MFQHLSVMGILLDHRARTAPEVQEILTRHGDKIIARHGVPDRTKEDGLITLTLEADQQEADALKNELSQFEGVKVEYFQMG